MPFFLAAIPWVLGAARIAVPLALRVGSTAATVGRGAATAVRYRKTIGTLVTSQAMLHDQLDITKTGLTMAFLTSGNSNSSAAQNRKAASGRPRKATRVTVADPRQGGYRPNNRAGGYMPRF